MNDNRPRFCPACGAALEGETAAVAIIDEGSGDGGYDCYCEACGWSGDVFPDAEQGAHAEETSVRRVAVIAERLPASFYRGLDSEGARTRRR